MRSAAQILEVDELEQWRQARYAGWTFELGNSIMNGNITLADLHRHELATPDDQTTSSGHQGMLENIVARTIDSIRQL